jgi:uncharacterized protein (TIGR02246 family)
MTAQRRFGLAIALVAALVVGHFLATGKMAGQADDPAKGEAKPGKGPRAREFIAAFNKGDARAVAAFWTPEGDYVDQVGRHFKGRAALEKLYTKISAANKGAKLAITVSSARMVGADTAIEDGLTEVTPADGGPPTVAGFSAVLVKKDGVWYFESVRDAIAHPPSNAEHLEGIQWLLGRWVGEAEKGESGAAAYQWAENRNFIVSHFTTTLNGIPVTGGTQWIAWDAVDKQIRSWSFYSGGGVGQATWTEEGGNWVVRTTARTADGKKVSVTNTITKVDDDHLTWQVTKLTVDGAAVPDHAPVKMKRVKP